MLDFDTYRQELDSEMKGWRVLMKEAWGEVPIIEPIVNKALYVTTEFDLGDFPHKGQKVIVWEGNEDKTTPKKVAKNLVTEINSHRNFCNRCGVPVPHVLSRQHGISKWALAYANWSTGQPWTEEEKALYDIPPDVLEKKLHPVISKRLERRLQVGSRG